MSQLFKRTKKIKRFPEKDRLLKNGFSISSSINGSKTTMPSEADTVIIGGGISGISTAYHLAKKSSQRVIILEKTEITSGSTWHAAGLITAFHPGVNIKRLHWTSLNLYARIEKETGQEVGFHRCGSLRLATSKVRLDEMKYQMSRQGWHNAPQILLNTHQVQDLMPLLDIDSGNILGGLYNPYDGHIDPYSLTQALARGARKAGAKIFQNTPVVSLSAKENGWIVETSHGEISTTNVVNAAGFWAKDVGDLSGLKLPLVPIQHQYIVTKPIPQLRALSKEFPVLRHLDGSFYLRRERNDCLLIGPYESEKTMKICEEWARVNVPIGFGKELFDPDVDRLYPHLEKAMELLPCFAEAQIQSIINGPITYSPDVLPIIGPTKLPNMWITAGYAYGIVHGGGAGEFLSEWILNGEPPYHLQEVDPSRYGDWTNLSYTLEKVRESYGWNNAPSYPMDDRPAGRSYTRRTSDHIHKEMKNNNAFMGNNNGWEQALWYSKKNIPKLEPNFYRNNHFPHILNEIKSLKKCVAIRDLTASSKFTITGRNATKYLNTLICGQLPGIGSTKPSILLNQKSGTIYGECNLTALENDKYLMVSGAGTEMYLLRHMEKVQRVYGFRDVFIENLTEKMGVLSLAGPLSTSLLSKFIHKNWSYLDSGHISFKGVDCLGIKFSSTGEEGWEIYVNRETSDLNNVFDLLIQEGTDYGLSFYGSLSNEILRLEKGMKAWGSELTNDVTPFEADVEHLVDLKKESNFIGKEALERKQSNQSLQRVLALISVENDEEQPPVDPEGHMSLWLCNKVIGHTTSGSFSPLLNKGIAFAYVPPLFSLPSTEMEVEIMGKRRKSRVLEFPPASICT